MCISVSAPKDALLPSVRRVEIVSHQMLMPGRGTRGNLTVPEKRSRDGSALLTPFSRDWQTDCRAGGHSS
jgi:hypothetical protein